MVRTVAFLLYPGFQLLDVAGPAEVFDAVNVLQRRQAYRLEYVALSSTALSSSGFEVRARPLSTLKSVHTVFVGGALNRHLRERLADMRFIAALTRLGQRAQRVCAVCTGAFLAARSGLYDGAPITTHWGALESLKREYPRCQVVSGPIYVRKGKLWSSAGVTAGIDLALAVVREDHGAAVAASVAKFLVVSLRRPGNQSQFSEWIDVEELGRDELEDLVPWLRSQVRRRVSVDQMARHCGLSVRTFHRRCKEIYGRTPNALEEWVRIHAAKDAIEHDRVSLKRLASAFAYSSPSALNHAFRKHFGTTPGDYLTRMRLEPADEPGSPPSRGTWR